MKLLPRRSTPLTALFLALAAILAAACSRARKEEAGVFRIIDRIGGKNVVASPFKKPDPANASLAEIAGKFALNELGTGENPFGIKMKLHLGPSDVNALAAAPPTTIAFETTVPPDARMEFNFGIRCDDGILKAAEGERSAEFAVTVTIDGADTTLFRRTIRLEHGKALAFNGQKIDLARFAGRRVSFRLITEGDARALAFWFDPIIYPVRREARHVILISLDTLRSDHLSCYGYGRDTSPNIDLLARDGVLFAETRAPSPWTLPSHLSMMTSLDTIDHGVSTPEYRLDPRTPTLAELLKAGGFYNAAFTGGGFVSGFYGFNKGFDTFRVLGRVVDKNAAAGLAVKASRWIRAHQDRDSFLFLHTYQIHNPYGSEEPWNSRYLRPGASMTEIDMSPLQFNHEGRFQRLPEETRQDIINLYDGDIRYTDDVLIGRLVAELKALGVYDRTMIVLTSDHGEEFAEHGAWLHTHSVYEETIRVPLIVKFFGSRNAGKVVRSPAYVIDVMPTIAGELGLAVPRGALDGTSLLPAAEGREGAADPFRVGLSDLAPRLMGKHIPRKVALIRPPFEFILNEPYSAEDLAYFTSPPPPLPEIELFDLSRDPGETRNLASEQPNLVREFMKIFRERYTPRRKPGAAKVGMGDDLVKQLKTLGYL